MSEEIKYNLILWNQRRTAQSNHYKNEYSCNVL